MKTHVEKLCNESLKAFYRYLKEQQSHQDKNKKRFKPKKYF
jgi:hypothetical protein